MTDRMERINELLLQELSQLLQEESEKLGMIQINAIHTSRDLDHATVWVSAITGELNPDRLHQLAQALMSFRPILLRRLSLKRIPTFTVTPDTAQTQINRVEQLLDAMETAPPSANDHEA